MRRRIKQSQTLEERLLSAAQKLREEAKSQPESWKRETLLRKARQIEMTRNLTAALRPS
ncbi:MULTISPECIES: hypothetical protein [unclassified Bradyrhizobium]|uniref:hypothetical protein n=1 Tax=unclassified Bradyrhizobium TaxID=2631580 RepID=UPI0024B08267|nr:hypothetical protein [Bradyrhizobium sp. CB2312]WFU75590.1 hypothetical protein QA642_17145 [Bradyrhizobium sp. CB2312]